MQINIKLRELFIKYKETFQLVYGVSLIILIPALIAFNSMYIIGGYDKILNDSLQRNACNIGRSVASFIKVDVDSQDIIQKNIDSLFEKKTEDLLGIEVLVPEDDNFKIIASEKKDKVGNIYKYRYYQMAWLEDNGCFAVKSPRLPIPINADNKKVAIDNSPEDPFWLASIPISDSSGTKKILLSVKISSAVIEESTEQNRTFSIDFLYVTIFIVICFLAVSIRFWDYAILYKRIKEVDQMKDEFISMASHELRTPLGIIKGYISLVLEGTFGKIENPKMKESLDRAMTSTNRLNDLVEDLLNVSRIEQGRLEVDIRKIKIEPIIEEITSQLEITAKEKNLALEYVKPEIELPLISADTDRLKQVLINLIGNSIKYTQKGTVKITTELKGKKLEIKIADTGIGMSVDEQKHLFEKFYRIKNENTEKIVGTGLGLWITKQIVELMKGNIYVESIKGVGTHISVVLNVA